MSIRRGSFVGVLAMTSAWIACSGETTGSSPLDAGIESGSSGTDDAAAKDGNTASDVVTKGDTSVADVGGGCAVDADIHNLNLKDAALGDSGNGSIGLCSACINQNCASELTGCQDDCDCREAVVGFYDCIGTGKAITTCGSALITGGSAAQGLGLCAVNSGCSSACGQ